ncbi:MAG: alpha/beta hydrolase, partial [Planctomycetota bacterium]
VPDTAFNPLSEPERNVVLYGNAGTNRAWPALLSVSQVQVLGGQVYVGARPEAGDDIGVLMVRPRRNSRTAMVAVVGGTSIGGMRLTNRLRYFFAGVAYPDLLLIGQQAPVAGAAGVRAAGWFGPDWSLESGDVAWRDLAL